MVVPATVSSPSASSVFSSKSSCRDERNLLKGFSSSLLLLSCLGVVSITPVLSRKCRDVCTEHNGPILRLVPSVTSGPGDDRGSTSPASFWDEGHSS